MGVAVGGPGVCVGVTVGVAVRVGVTVAVAVGLAVAVCVGVAVTVAVAVGVAVIVGVAVTVGVGVTVGVAVGVGVNGSRATKSSVAGQFFPPVPPTELVMTLLVVPAAVNVDVRSNAVPKATLMTYGDSAGAPSRTQMSLSSGAVHTTAIGSGGI